MEDDDSILLTTLLDPLERSIFHDSEGEEIEDGMVFFQDNDEEMHFGVNDSLPLRKQQSFDKENMNPSPAVSVSKKSFLSSAAKSRRNTPLRSIGNQIKNV